MWIYIIFTGLVILITMVMIRQKNRITFKKKQVKEKKSPMQKIVKDTITIVLEACGDMEKRVNNNNENLSNNEYKDIVWNMVDDISNVYKESNEPAGIFTGEMISYTKPSIENFLENIIFQEKSVKEK